jgi:hypothetical protein
VLNTAHLSPRLCADILVDAVSNPVFQEGPETRRELTDRMLEARIRSAFRSDRELDQRGLHVRVSVENSEAHLYGVVSDSVTGRRAEELASAQAGVVAVRTVRVRAYGFDSRSGAGGRASGDARGEHVGELLDGAGMGVHERRVAVALGRDGDGEAVRGDDAATVAAHHDELAGELHHAARRTDEAVGDHLDAQARTFFL